MVAKRFHGGKAASSPKHDTLYLQRIGQRWYVRLPVPAHLRKELGPYLRKALGTSDLAEARRRRWDVLPILKARIETHEKKRPAFVPSPEALTYEQWRAKLREEVGPASFINEFDGEEMMNPLLDPIIDSLQGVEDGPAVEALQDHFQDAELVSETLASYLEANPKRNATTAANYKTAVKLWIEVNGERPLRRAKRKQVLDWLEAVGKGKAKDTVKRYATVMGHLWEWVWRKEDNKPQNPFEGAVKASSVKTREAASYDFYTDEELIRAHAAVKDDPELGPAFMVSLYAGLRLEECIRAVREEVAGVPCFVVKGGKTANAARVVPIHPVLERVVVPATAKASTLSVRYGRVMRSLEMPKGKTFHSLRKAFATALERAGCPEAIAARLLGHRPLAALIHDVVAEGWRV